MCFTRAAVCTHKHGRNTDLYTFFRGRTWNASTSTTVFATASNATLDTSAMSSVGKSNTPMVPVCL